MKQFKTDIPDEQIPRCVFCKTKAEPLPLYIRTKHSRQSHMGLVLVCNEDYLLHRTHYGDDVTFKMWSYSWRGVFLSKKLDEKTYFCTNTCMNNWWEQRHSDFLRELYGSEFANSNFRIAPNSVSTISDPTRAGWVEKTKEFMARIQSVGYHHNVWS